MMRRFLSWGVNIAVVWLEWNVLMRLFYRFGKDGMPVRLMGENLEYLKYLTVLSNILTGVAAAAYALALPLAAFHLLRRMPGWVVRMKYTAATLAGLTLAVAACYLLPRDGAESAFGGPNLWLHLVLPLLAVLDWTLLDREGTLRLRASLLPTLCIAAYGGFYLGNLIVNGWGGRNHPNDWYRFAESGPAGAFIAVGLMLAAGWTIAACLRLSHGGNDRAGKPGMGNRRADA